MGAGTVRAAWLVTLLLLVVVVAAPRAHAADRPFAARYRTNDTGDIAFAANTTMTCPAAATGCAAAQAGVDNGPVAPTNNTFQMAHVDVDADPRRSPRAARRWPCRPGRRWHDDDRERVGATQVRAAPCRREG